MKTRHWDRIGNGGLTFTELGFGSAPLGNLYRAVPDDEAARHPGRSLGERLPLLRHRAALRARACPRRGSTASCAAGSATTTCCPARSGGCFRSRRRSSAPASASSSTRRRAASDTTTAMTASCVRSSSRWSGSASTASTSSTRTISTSSRTARRRRWRRGSRSSWHSGYSALLSLRDQGVIKAFGAGINEWQAGQWLAERGDFDLFLLAGRYTLLEQESLETLPAALRAARHRHRARRPIQFRHPGDRAEARRLLQLFGSAAGDPRQGRAHRGGVPAARRQAGRGGAAVSAAASERRLGHSGRPERRAGEAPTAPSSTSTYRPPLWSDLKVEGLMRDDAPVG